MSAGPLMHGIHSVPRRLQALHKRMCISIVQAAPQFPGWAWNTISSTAALSAKSASYVQYFCFSVKLWFKSARCALQYNWLHEQCIFNWEQGAFYPRMAMRRKEGGGWQAASTSV
eukprot:1141163-Pelagomonas_calceolata.AAC.2